MFPGRNRIRLPGLRQPVERPLRNDVVVSVIVGDLAADDVALRFIELVEVQFIPEGAGHRHDAAGFERCRPPGLVVGTGRNVRPHRRRGIEQARAVLDLQPFDRVGVVAGPDLRHVVEHPGVEPAAAAGTPFDQQLRITLQQQFMQTVHPEHVAVEELLLAVGRERRRTDFGQMAVGIPLDVFDRGAVEDGADRPEEVIDHLRLRHIQHQLLTPFRARTARNRQHPLRMRPKEFAVARHHLRLEPQSELEPQFVDPLHQRRKSPLELRFEDEPVAETASVVVAVAEPAVGEHQHLNAEPSGVLRNPDQFFGVEVEVGRLPVVHQNRTLAVAPVTADQMAAEEIVEGAAHTAQPLR